jgi:hypothetical protein
MLSEAERDKRYDQVACALRELFSIAAADGPETAAEMAAVVLATAVGSAQRYLGDGLARHLLERQLELIDGRPQPLH